MLTYSRSNTKTVYALTARAKLLNHFTLPTTIFNMNHHVHTYKVKIISNLMPNMTYNFNQQLKVPKYIHKAMITNHPQIIHLKNMKLEIPNRERTKKKIR